MNGERLVQNIKALTVQKGFKMKELLALCGITSGAVSQWKNGLTKPHTSTLYKIATVLGVTIQDLLEGTEKEIPASPEASGVEVNPRYYELSDSERAAVDALIDHYATIHQSGG